MPRFYFSVYDDEAYPDLDGTELPDLNAARDHAVRYAASLLQGCREKFWNDKTWSLEVRDESGILLFSLTFTAAEMPFAKAVAYKTAD